MASWKLGKWYHSKGAGGSTGGKNEFRSQATACPMCEIHSLHFFLNKLLKRKSRSQNFIGQSSGFWKCVWVTWGLVKMQILIQSVFLSWESSFLKAPRWHWCSGSVNHSLSCETIKKQRMLELVLIYKNRFIYNIEKALDNFVMTCGVIMQIICTTARFAGYLLVKSLRVLIHEDVLIIVP